VEREPHRLGGGRVQTQLRVERYNPRSNEVGKVRKMGAYQLLQLSSLMLVRTQQVLVSSECLNAPRRRSWLNTGEFLEEACGTKKWGYAILHDTVKHAFN
jgi:hypothetical protein